MKTKLSGELIKNAAGNRGNMVWEVGEGIASVEEWWGTDERKKQEYSLKYLRKNNVSKAILFWTTYITK